MLSQIKAVQCRNVTQIPQFPLIIVESWMSDADGGRFDIPLSGTFSEPMNPVDIGIYNGLGCCFFGRGD